MALSKIFLSTLVVVSTFTDKSTVSAFAIQQRSTHFQTRTKSPIIHPMTATDVKVARLRGGGAGTTTTQVAASKSSAPSSKRVRLTALDGLRFFLIMHIVLGHFFRFANPSEFLMKFFAQINVSVGAFFVLSGYVTAYTSTEVAERKASPKMTDQPSQKWIISKAMSYYPLHWLVCLLFSPMFLYVDVHNGGWFTAAKHALLSTTLTQAWFPMHAEVWNAPTWFLSSLTFATALLPFSLPKIAEMNKEQLKKAGFWLFLVNLLPKLGYVYDLNAWNVVEGMTAPKDMINLPVFNAQRFLPLFNAAEVLLGVVACRLAMLDGADDGKEKVTKTNALSTAVPGLGLLGILVARAAGVVPDWSDLLVRSLLFVPLFLKFMMGIHRNTVQSVSDPVSSLLSNKVFVWLGGLSFPIYIVHGPIGQVFYKRLIAGKLWGGVLKGPEYFALFMGTVFLSAWAVQAFFLQNQAVKKWSKNRVEQLSSWM